MSVRITTDGLVDNPSPASSLPSVSWAVAGGSADVISAAYDPVNSGLTDGLILGFRATQANATTVPTFSPDDLTAHVITRLGGVPLEAGDIPYTDAEVLVRYNEDETHWELLNPAPLSSHFKALLLDDTGGQNVNTAQPWFPTAGALTFTKLGWYDFEGVLYLSRAAGTTSHTTAVLFGGTTGVVVGFLAMAKTGDANDLQPWSGFWSTGNPVVKAASTSATEQTIIRVQGTVIVGFAGTFIPQFKYSAAPGGAPTIKAGSYFKLTWRPGPASAAWA